MAVARAVPAALALVVAMAAGPSAAQVAARPVAIYPIVRTEGSAADDAQGLLESAARRAAARSEDMVLSEPLVVRASCGPAATAPAACLARLAGEGLLLRAVLHRSERSAAIAVEAVDGLTGGVIGPVTVGIDTFIQNPEPLARALLMLLEDARSAARRHGASRAQVAAPPPAPVEPPPVRVEPQRPEPSRAQAQRPDAPRAPAADPDLRATEPPRAAPKAAAPTPTAGASVARAVAPRSWARSAAPWVAGAGLALLASAAAMSTVNGALSRELDRKARDGTLTAADATRYRTVERNNQLTVLLAGSGGALTIGAAVMFTAVPSHGGASVALAGRF